MEIVGRSDNWTGPVNDYTRNVGDVGPKRIVFVGASYLFVHKVLRDMLLVGGFDKVHLVVHDIDPVPLKLVADLLEKIARQTSSGVTVSRTLDRVEALRGADAVLLSINVGGQEADYRSAAVCARFGIPVGIGDTMGPAALARNLRTIPAAVAIAHDMERLCPNAVMLNFTNPMSCVTGAMARAANIPVWGLCHSGDGLSRFIADVFGCSKDEIRITLGGVNHQSFVTRLIVRGADRTSELLEATLRSKARLRDTLLETRLEEVQLQKDLYRILGVWPSTGHTHLAEFYPFFLTERRMQELGLASTVFKPDPDHKRIIRRECPEILRYWAYGPEPVGDLHLLTDEHAHELLWSVFTGQPFTRVLNILNCGTPLAGIPPDACVEMVTTIAGRVMTAAPVALPPAALALVQRWTSIHDLTIKAALDCDRAAARQALFLDAHTSDMYDIDPLLEEFLRELAEWLPDGWTASR